MIKNIVFDMGNVLLNYDPNVSINMYIENPNDRNIIKKELFESEEWHLKDMGLISNEEMYTRISQRIPDHLKEGLKNCIQNWQICMKPIEGGRECLEKYKSDGYGIYIISNAGHDFYDYFEEFMPLTFFDGVVVSADIHIVKPDIEIYEYFLNQYNLQPEECIFVDDRMDNVEAAISAGMKAVQFCGDYSVIDEIIENDDKKDSAENYMTEGMCIGMCAGVALGTTGVCNLAIGLSLGMLIGLVIGMLIKR